MSNGKFFEERTHQLVVDESLGDSHADQLIAAENMVLEITLEYGTSVDILLWENELTKTKNNKLSEFKSSFNQTETSDRIWKPRLGSEYHASLPNGRDSLMELLQISEPDDWIWRLYDIKQILVNCGNDWLYQSTPDETHIRNVNITSVGDELLYEIMDAIEPIHGADLYSV